MTENENEAAAAAAAAAGPLPHEAEAAEAEAAAHDGELCVARLRELRMTAQELRSAVRTIARCRARDKRGPFATLFHRLHNLVGLTREAERRADVWNGHADGRLERRPDGHAAAHAAARPGRESRPCLAPDFALMHVYNSLEFGGTVQHAGLTAQRAAQRASELHALYGRLLEQHGHYHHW